MLLVAGYFDQHMRQSLFTTWCNHMQQAHIQFKSDVARIEVNPVINILYLHVGYQCANVSHYP